MRAPRQPRAPRAPREPRFAPAFLDQYKDPRWQKRRLEIFERDGWECTHCESKDKTLEVHHRIYRKGFMLWEAYDGDLQTLCHDCHVKYTRQSLALRETIAKLDYRDIEILVGLANAINGYHTRDDGLIPVANPDQALGVSRYFRLPLETVLPAIKNGHVHGEELFQLMRRRDGDA